MSISLHFEHSHHPHDFSFIQLAASAHSRLPPANSQPPTSPLDRPSDRSQAPPSSTFSLPASCVSEVTLRFWGVTASVVGANSPLFGWIRLDVELNKDFSYSSVNFIYGVAYLTDMVSFGIPRLICVSFGITRLKCASFGITRLICASFGITGLICASFEITRLICASFGITRLICASFGITRLICASFGITTLICASFGITRLIYASVEITRLIDVCVLRNH
ncbi:SH3 domain-containing protein C23A1.17-like [Cucumis melo var. makuwa]|uniref:SH3 domain-containing protein C23A1.17-like n=1 Tax=Cucumis melo var. makuwa TaxID=1194695 RepID=A0A5A7VN04_CUCMM|nr:SH3 domain-containing protein C23A1.17-like [Cucumis melo var. makuwa]